LWFFSGSFLVLFWFFFGSFLVLKFGSKIGAFIGVFVSYKEEENVKKRKYFEITLIKSDTNLDKISYFTVLSTKETEIKNFSLLNEIKKDKEIFLYESRINLINEIQEKFELIWSINNGGNRKNKLIIGLPSIGKTYLIKKTATIIGDNFKNILVTYLDVQVTKASISIALSIKKSAEKRNINIKSDNLPDIVTELEKNKIFPLIFIDEAQDLYPQENQTIKNLDKISIVDEIQSIINYNDILIFVTGSSVRLASYAHKTFEFPFMNDYQNLNNSRIQTFSLYPILKKDEFQIVCDLLKIKYSDIHELYSKNGGRIGDLEGNNKSQINIMLFNDERLIFTVIQIIYTNTYDKDEMDFFDRKYITGRDLTERLTETFGKNKNYEKLFEL
jgi:hypothetical protein